MNKIILEGEQVKVIPLNMDYLHDLFEAGKSQDIWQYSSRGIKTLDDMRMLITDALSCKENGTEYPFIIFDKSLQSVVGSTRYLNIALNHRNLEIGWTWLSPNVWRTRVNTETKYLLLKHAFEKLNIARVQFKADVRNERSNRAIERLGAIREGRLRKDRILGDGHIRDAYIYSIIDEEWMSVKEKLERILM